MDLAVKLESVSGCGLLLPVIGVQVELFEPRLVAMKQVLGVINPDRVLRGRSA
jgi:hypothetical protein